MRHHLLAAVTAALLLFCAFPATTSGPSRIDRWRASLKEIDGQLRAGKYATAERGAVRLLKEMVNTAGLGQRAAYSLAVASAFRALGEMGSGDQEAASWSWYSALNLFPEIAKTDLSPYGEPGLALRALKRREFRPNADPSRISNLPDGVRPKKRKGSAPVYPQALLAMAKEGQYAVETVIGTDGKIREPILLTAVAEPAMAYVVLETLRDWEFEPVHVLGKPVEVRYTLTVTFDAR